MGEAAQTLNHGSTRTNPEVVRNALIDHMTMAIKYKPKITFTRVRGWDKSTNMKSTP
jgi:hypothetical protein